MKTEKECLYIDNQGRLAYVNMFGARMLGERYLYHLVKELTIE